MLDHDHEYYLFWLDEMSSVWEEEEGRETGAAVALLLLLLLRRAGVTRGMRQILRRWVYSRNWPSVGSSLS